MLALDDLLRGPECLAGTETGFRGGDVAGVAVSIRKYFRTLFLDVLVAPLAVVQPLRNRLRQRRRQSRISGYPGGTYGMSVFSLCA